MWNRSSDQTFLLKLFYLTCKLLWSQKDISGLNETTLNTVRDSAESKMLLRTDSIKENLHVLFEPAWRQDESYGLARCSNSAGLAQMFSSGQAMGTCMSFTVAGCGNCCTPAPADTEWPWNSILLTWNQHVSRLITKPKCCSHWNNVLFWRAAGHTQVVQVAESKS